MKLYGRRNPIKQGEFYTKHLMAMTSEGLHDKSDIAKELAHRDMQIAELKDKLDLIEYKSKIRKQRLDIVNSPVKCLEILNNMQLKMTALENNGLKEWENYNDAMEDYEDMKFDFRDRDK